MCLVQPLVKSRRSQQPVDALQVTSFPKVDHDAALDVAGSHSAEDVVDVLEAFGRHGRLHLSLT